MALRTAVVIVALLTVLRTGAPASFSNLLSTSWMGFEKGKPESFGEVEVVYLPPLLRWEALSSNQPHDIPLPYMFNAFGRNFELKLKPNRRLLAPGFQVWSERGEEKSLSTVDAACHYLHTGQDTLAALSACKGHDVNGIIMVDNSTFEVRPLATGRRGPYRDGRTPHEIRRVQLPSSLVDDVRPIPLAPRRQPKYYRRRGTGHRKYTIELGLFLDANAYKLFFPLFNHNEADLRDMLIGYVNAIQALFWQRSIGTPIGISLVRLTILRNQPPELNIDAEGYRILDAFCAYEKKLNAHNDKDPQHWDLAALLSGSNLYSMDRGQRSFTTLGLAPVNAMCTASSCLATEFGVKNMRDGLPYPSTGFGSVYVIAHEIGHTLGMVHDGAGNSCPTHGYIMSAGASNSGQATWSKCSSDKLLELHSGWAPCLEDGGDNTIDTIELDGEPGIIWNAKKQCEIFLHDKDAATMKEEPSAEICTRLVCKSPHRKGVYYAGPALPGTICGKDMWCQGGECVPTGGHIPVHGPSSTDGTEAWSPWSEGPCQSGCSLRARGFKERRRTCLSSVCNQPSYDTVLCNDRKVCGKKTRVSTTDLAARMCFEFATKIKGVNGKGGGFQAPHNPNHLWKGCAVFCLSSDNGGFYSPRAELNNIGVDAYFPDGTWCHNDGKQDYFCQQHHCLPENFSKN